MIPGFESIVEERIKKAQKEGQFENLEGANKPLEFETYTGPEEMRMAHKILKNAGFLPPEVELRKKIFETEQLLDAACEDDSAKDKISRRLAYLMKKLDAIRQEKSGFSPGLTLADRSYRSSIAKKLS